MDRAIGIGVTVIWAAALSLLILSGCATPAPQPVALAPACWTAEPFLGAFKSCGELFANRDVRRCLCFADALRETSPDPDAEATAAEVLEAAGRCGLVLKSSLTGGTDL